MNPPEPPLPSVLAAELARVRVAVARARDDIAEGKMPLMSDLNSLVTGVCNAAAQAAKSSTGGIDPGAAAALESLLAELNALEQDVKTNRDRLG